MNSTTKFITALCMATLAGSSTLGAQAADFRWQAWVGCWAPVAGQNGMPRELGGTSTARVCVTPAKGTSAVEIVTVVSGKVVDRTRIEADGAPHPISRDGCTGAELARWAATGIRLYMSTTMTCSGGVERKGNAVLAFTQRYEWLDVRGMSSREASGVSVARYSAVDDSTGIPADIRALVGMRLPATNNAMLAASAPMTLADIADVANFADSGVTATWLTERTQGVKVSVNAKQLVMLADQGVPPSVIDVVVAIANPEEFVLNPNSREAEFKAGGQRVTSGALSSSNIMYVYPGAYGYPFGFDYGFSPYSLYGGYNPYYGYSGYGYGSYGYGYGSYGYGRGYYNPYGGYYPGSQPIIVVNRGDTGGTAPEHGRVVKGRGYSSPSGGSSSGGGGSSSSSSGSSGSSSSSAGGSSSSTGSSSSAGGDRTAVKKPPM